MPPSFRTSPPQYLRKFREKRRSEKLVAAWRARAIKMYPSDFRDAGEDVRTRLLAALCASWQAEITDALVELLLALVHKINARAERRVERQLTAELKKVRGKEGILFRLADAAVGQPEGTVRKVLYPMVGEKTLRDLVAEAKANEKAFKAKVRTTLRSSYGSYYRQMLPPLLRTLGFRSPSPTRGRAGCSPQTPMRARTNCPPPHTFAPTGSSGSQTCCDRQRAPSVGKRPSADTLARDHEPADGCCR
jgi:hypothetical protein